MNKPSCVLWNAIALLILAAPIGRAGTPGKATTQKIIPQNDWRQGDANSAHTRFLPETIKPPLRLAWRRSISTSLGPVVAAGPIVYVAEGSMFLAINSSDGRILWANGNLGINYTGIPNSMIAISNELLIYSSPSLIALSAADGHIIFTRQIIGSDRGTLIPMDNRRILLATNPDDQPKSWKMVLVDAVSGHVLDKRDVEFQGFQPIHFGTVSGARSWLYACSNDTLLTIQGGLHGRLHGMRYLRGAPAVHIVTGQGRLFLAEYPDISGLDLRLKAKWRRTLRARYDYRQVFQYEGGTLSLAQNVLVFWDWQKMYGIRPATGKIIWAASLDQSPYASDSQHIQGVLTPPAIAGQTLYAVAASHYHGPTDTLIALDVATGKKLWSERIGQSLRSLIVQKGAVYVADEVYNPKMPRMQPYQHFLLKFVPAHKQ